MISVGLAGPYYLAKSSLGVSVFGVALVASVGGAVSNVAESVGVAIGVLGGIYAAAAFLRDREIRMLRNENETLLRDRGSLRARWIAAEIEADQWRIRAAEATERSHHGDLLAASDMVERFREWQSMRESGEHKIPPHLQAPVSPIGDTPKPNP